MDTAQNNNEFLEGESNSRENFENKWNYSDERLKLESELNMAQMKLQVYLEKATECKKD